MLSPTPERFRECQEQLHKLLATYEQRWLVRDWTNAMIADVMDSLEGYFQYQGANGHLDPALAKELSDVVSRRIQSRWSIWIMEFLRRPR